MVGKVTSVALEAGMLRPAAGAVEATVLPSSASAQLARASESPSGFGLSTRKVTSTVS